MHLLVQVIQILSIHFLVLDGINVLQCSKLAVARLPETTKISFGQPVFRKNKGPVAQDCASFAIRTTWIFPNFEHWFWFIVFSFA